ncbi:MAG: hypothetical protein ACM34K_18165 [Bacillota bacterium]
MRTLISLAVLIAFFALSGCSKDSESPVSPQKDKSAFSKMVFTQVSVKQYSVNLIDPGVTTIENGKQIIKKMVMEDRFEASSPLLTGKVINTVSSIMDLTTGGGAVWGNLLIIPDADAGGGKWEIAYIGKMMPAGASVWTSTIKGFGRGVGGTINKMRYSADFVIVSTVTPTGISWEGNGTVNLAQVKNNKQ